MHRPAMNNSKEKRVLGHGLCAVWRAGLVLYHGVENGAEPTEE
jgi:hypothetical protein